MEPVPGRQCSVKCRTGWLLAVLLCMSRAVSALPAEKETVHTVIPVECTSGYFEWQILGFLYRCILLFTLSKRRLSLT